jgi:hypothetical protein
MPVAPERKGAAAHAGIPAVEGVEPWAVSTLRRDLVANVPTGLQWCVFVSLCLSVNRCGVALLLAREHNVLLLYARYWLFVLFLLFFLLCDLLLALSLSLAPSLIRVSDFLFALLVGDFHMIA